MQRTPRRQILTALAVAAGASLLPAAAQAQAMHCQRVLKCCRRCRHPGCLHGALSARGAAAALRRCQ